MALSTEYYGFQYHCYYLSTKPIRLPISSVDSDLSMIGSVVSTGRENGITPVLVDQDETEALYCN